MVGTLRMGKLSRPDFRSDPIGEFEPSSGYETIYWDSLPVFFFFITESKYHIHIKRTTTGVVSIKSIHIFQVPCTYIKIVLLHLQIRAWNLHVVNPY